MKIVKLTAFILLLSVIIGAFTACLVTKEPDAEPEKNKSNIENEYQAEFFNSSYTSYSSFLDENRIYAYYKENGEYYLEENAPKSRTYIIEDFETYREIFETSTNPSIDFDEEIVYYYMFRNWHSSDHYLDEISIIDDTLHIYVKEINTFAPNLHNSEKYNYGIPGGFSVKMKRTGVSNVEFHFECDICDNEGKID